ncbi:ExeA family protein [Ramlibacter sp. Leaf400]|uniref:ExeA family protein n=1 Tax=Ramlibacter sp. Leaf400 TaxID=1736365 RepID=UPI0006F5F377|nr:ExeA family protein [Ramlibacter sp. Leaf400]KQT10206.1 peptidoglycan-binding protein [Ramlibacter sp. Leaf400]
MYAPYFGLSHEPFSIAPDPRYLFMSERHREALAHLLYGLGGGGGFVLLTGEIGTGKTTVCRGFLEQIPDNCNVAYIFNPKLTVTELLQSVCEEFRIEVPRREGVAATVKDYLDPLNAFLLRSHAQGRNSVLIIDEAQNLSADVLEQLRLLTNLETSERKLLQIVLIGQPELRELLSQPQLEQLAQRVIARFHLDALTRTETQQYVRHRLEVAGLSRALPFDRSALERIHKRSGGVPRRINLLCDRALLGAFGRSEAGVTRAIVDQAAREVFGDPAPSAQRTWPRQAAVLGVGLLAGAGLVAAAHWWTESSLPVATPPVAAAAPAVPPPEPPATVEVASVQPVVAQAAAPAAAASSPTPPTLLRDERQAWRELAQAWKLEPGEGDPCQALARESVHCFTRTLPLVLIRQLDRPGIVTLDRDTGKPSYAVLTALNDKSATLSAGGSEQTVTLAALAARWNGEWATLWRAPAGFDPRSPEREGRKLSQWVDEQLARAGAKPGDGEATGGSLRTRIRSFQLAQGLPADGVLGPMTFMQLNRSAGLDEPHLRQAP